MITLNITKDRIASLAGAVLAAALILTGCSSATSTDVEESTAASDSLLPAAEGNTEYPYTVATPWGESVLEQRPERIAVVTKSTRDLDSVIALGVTPVLENTANADKVSWLSADQLSAIEVRTGLGTTGELSNETVASVSPDLIIAVSDFSMDETLYGELSRIAPVVTGPDGDDEETWDEALSIIAEALDLSEIAEGLIENVETSIEETASRNPDLSGKTISYAVISTEEYGVWTQNYPGSLAADYFEMFGLTPSEGVAEFDSSNFTVSNELYGKLDADILLLAVQSTSVDPSYFLDNAIVQSIPAVAENRYAVIEPDPESGFEGFAWGLSMQSVLSLDYVTDRFEELVQRIDIS